MDTITAIRILAMRAVIKADYSYLSRFMYRHYSKTYSTPLKEAMELPLEDVLQTFFEEHYASLDDAEREKEIQDLLETPEERLVREKREADEELMLQKIEEEAVAQSKKLETMGDLRQDPKLQPLAISKETELPASLQNLIKPDIEIKFATPEAFEALIKKLDEKTPNRNLRNTPSPNKPLP